MGPLQPGEVPVIMKLTGSGIFLCILLCGGAGAVCVGSFFVLEFVRAKSEMDSVLLLRPVSYPIDLTRTGPTMLSYKQRTRIARSTRFSLHFEPPLSDRKLSMLKDADVTLRLTSSRYKTGLLQAIPSSNSGGPWDGVAGNDPRLCSISPPPPVGGYELTLQVNKPIDLPPGVSTQLIGDDEVEGQDMLPYLLVAGVGFGLIGIGGILLIPAVWLLMRKKRRTSLSPIAVH